MLQNKITVLNNAKSQAVSIGDFEQINVIDKELLDTQNTFSQLAMLQEVTQLATNANTTPTELVMSSLETLQNTPLTVQGPSASAIVNGYDISAYATDPLHEQKIQSIIDAMPDFIEVADVDNYIQNYAEGSPVTGVMVFSTGEKYTVDIPLLLAIMQNDSAFGTTGVGARTYNPGNVGNTGFAEYTYPSWEAGVDAVGDWLNRHRVSVLEV